MDHELADISSTALYMSPDRTDDAAVFRDHLENGAAQVFIRNLFYRLLQRRDIVRAEQRRLTLICQILQSQYLIEVAF